GNIVTSQLFKAMLFQNKILEQLGRKLIKRKQTISVAESVTSGFVQLALASAPDAACFYQGGITAYNIGQKYKHLGVEPVHAQSVNCVSQQVARQMAMNACMLFSSDWGIGITGYATPIPESSNELYAYYSIVFRNKMKAKGKITHRNDKPLEIQQYYTNYLLQKLEKLL